MIAFIQDKKTFQLDKRTPHRRLMNDRETIGTQKKTPPRVIIGLLKVIREVSAVGTINLAPQSPIALLKNDPARAMTKAEGLVTNHLDRADPNTCVSLAAFGADGRLLLLNLLLYGQHLIGFGSRFLIFSHTPLTTQ